MADTPNPKPVFVGSPQALELFADSARGFFLLNGNIRITFESTRFQHITPPGPMHSVVVGRVVLPFAQAEAMARNLLAFIEQQKNAPTPNAQGTTTIQ